MEDDARRTVQERIDAVAWYHEFEFPNGLAARTASQRDEHRQVWDFIRSRLDRIDFRGKTVLDLGCWDGYWSFYAERRGARRVLATDDFTQNWAGRDGLLLAKELLGSDVEVMVDLSVYDLTRVAEKFDVILCLGVYYHLFDPFYAFSQIRRLCHHDTVVVFEGDTAGGMAPRHVYWNPEDPQLPLFVPHPAALVQMLRASYFDVVEQTSMDAGLGAGLRRRASNLARSARNRKLDGLPSWLTRTVTVCTPMVGENAVHPYRPPFGLGDFDPRFR